MESFWVCLYFFLFRFGGRMGGSVCYKLGEMLWLVLCVKVWVLGDVGVGWGWVDEFVLEFVRCR